KAENPEDRRKIGEGRNFRVVNVVHRLRSMLTHVVEAQNRLELRPSLGKRPEVHGRDPSQAVPAKANKRAWKALRYLPSLVCQSLHHGMIAAHEVIDKLTAEG